MNRLLLVDDDPRLRLGLRLRLALEPGIEIAGEAGSGLEGLALVESLAPNIVITDIEMPELDGIAFTRRLVTAHPECAVIVLSLHDDTATRERALAAGATRFVSKHDGPDALVDAVLSLTALAQTGCG